jgi:mannose-6-phosphate isomerase-like protein (cupin superfamily)
MQAISIEEFFAFSLHNRTRWETLFIQSRAEMNMSEELIIVKDDRFWRCGEVQWSAELDPVYKVQVAPRSVRLPAPFQHQVGVRYYALAGNALFEADGEKTVLKRGNFTFIPAGAEYYLQGFDHSPSMLLVQAKTEQVEESWREVSERLRNQ